MSISQLVRQNVEAETSQSGNRLDRFDYAFLTLLGLILLYQVCVSPIVGLADDHDFIRIMRPAGIYYLDNPDSLRYYNYVNRYYGWYPVLSYKTDYPSSESLLVILGLCVNLVLTKGGLFDIVNLGLVHSILYIAAFRLLVPFFRSWSAVSKALMYSLLLGVFSDVGYVAYMNSLYSEPASLIFLLTLVATSLRLARATVKQPWLVLTFALSAVLFLTAKTQNIVAGPFLAYLAWRICLPRSSDNTATRWKNHLKRVVLPAALICVCVGYYSWHSRVSELARAANVYNTIFFSILSESENPRADLAFFGLDPPLVKHRGTSCFVKECTIPKRLEVYRKVGQIGILRFYMAKPSRFLRVASRAARKAFLMRPPVRGNFEYWASKQFAHDWKRAGRVGRLRWDGRSRAFQLWSVFKKHFVPKSLWFIVLSAVVSVSAATVKMKIFDRDWRQRIVSETHLILAMLCIAQFAAVILGEGDYNIIKHLFLFNLIWDICLIFLIAYILGGVELVIRRRQGAGG